MPAVSALGHRPVHAPGAGAPRGAIMELLATLEAQEAAAAEWPIAAAPVAAPRPPTGPWSVSQALGMVSARLRCALADAGATSPGVLRGLCDGSRLFVYAGEAGQCSRWLQQQQQP